jgi:hypothetical protein
MRFLLLLLFPVSILAQTSGLQFRQTQCNSRTQPINVEPGPIRFSWTLEQSARNLEQTAYQLVMATSIANLEAGRYDIWNTGKTYSKEYHPVNYPGQRIQSNTRYFWKLRVWDNQGLASNWSTPQSFQTSLWEKKDWKGAAWIGYEQLPDSERVVPGIHEPDARKMGAKLLKRSIVPQFRKSFQLKQSPSSAYLYVSGLGQYEMTINGKKPGEGFLTPGWSLYGKTCFYNCFDVTKSVALGENVLAATVGNGFFYINRERYFKLVTAWGYPMLITRLQLNYPDGSSENIVSDASWETRASPIIFSSIYGGEDYDARLEQKGWNLSGFKDSGWKNALLVKEPEGILRAEQDYPVAIQQRYTNPSIRPLKKNAYLYDFKQNTSGILSIRLKGKKGQKIRLIPAELLYGDTAVNQNASGKPYWYEYTLGSDEEESWQPQFTYYGFRYVQVEGARPESSPLTEAADSALPVVNALTLLHNRNASPETGTFSSSNPLMNRTYELIKRAIESNLQSVVTDCPHREKLGWLEQDFLMGNSIHYNFDIQSLYEALVRHMMDSQLENGLVPDIAPEYVPFGGGFRDSPEWGSASIQLPWLVYQWYDDVQLMEKAWPMMEKYMRYLGGKANGFILSHGLGDWYDLGPRFPGEAQLTPKSLTATAIYYQDLKLMAAMASVLLKKSEAASYQARAEEVRQAFNAKFFDAARGVYSTGSQTAMAMPLCFGMVEPAYQRKVVSNLIDSIKSNGKALTAGDVGYHYLVEALTRFGASELLYEMNNRDDVPGYGFQLRNGATALTESWPALPSVSNNHLMLGHLMEWFFAGLGGINQKEGSTGFRHLLINPQPVGDLTWVNSSFMTPQGLVKSEWKRSGAELELKLQIPMNSKADLVLPMKMGQRMYLNGKELKIIVADGRGVIEGIVAGDYVIKVR